MKPPRWHRDEIILALDLYHSSEPKEMGSSKPRVIELSRMLNELPIHKKRNDDQRFRNPSGVSLKLGNFQAIDPDFKGKGMYAHSRLDKEIFFEFRGRNNELKSMANQIKKIASDKELVANLNIISDENDDDVISAEEGRVMYKLHKYKERNSSIVRLKKEANKINLVCEVCGFDFAQKYGDLGIGFIECHHTKPVAELTMDAKTRIEDLALVCSNCHRMLHRKGLLSVKDLRQQYLIK